MRRHGPVRAFVAWALSAVVAIGAVSLVSAPAAGAAPAAQATPAAQTAQAAEAFRTKARPLAAAVPPVQVVAAGKVKPGLVKPLADNTLAAGLGVTLGVTTTQNYWYWASGVALTVNGLYYGEKAVVEDHMPSGKVLTFDPVVADTTGTAVTRIKADENFTEVGPHEIVVTSAGGRVGTAVLTVTQYQGRTLTVTTSPASLTQDAFYRKPVTVRGAGFAPYERLYFNMMTPDMNGFAVGASEGLRANAAGVFTYAIQATTVNSKVGKWTVSLIGYSGSNGSATFTVTDGTTTRHQDKKVSFARKVLPAASFASTTGAGFTLSAFKPWEVFDLTLRTPRGVDVSFGRFRANGDGVYTDAVLGYLGAPLGVYRLTAVSITTGSYGQGTFGVSDAAGNLPTAPTIAVTPKKPTRLDTLDPDTGITAKGTGFTPGEVVRFTIADHYSAQPALSSTSIVARPADDNGAVTFKVTLKKVPAVGTYDVTVFTYGTNALVLRAQLTIVK